MFGHLGLPLLIDTLVIPPGRKRTAWQKRPCILRRHSLYLATGMMPLGRHVRRGSEIRAEHLARANVISQSGHARHRCTHTQLREAPREVGNPLPEVLRGQSPTSGMDQGGKGSLAVHSRGAIPSRTPQTDSGQGVVN